MNGMISIDIIGPRNTNTTNRNEPITQQMTASNKLDLYKFRICFGDLHIPIHLWHSFCFVIQCTVSDVMYTAKICLRQYIRTHTHCDGDTINCGVNLFETWFQVNIKL